VNGKQAGTVCISNEFLFVDFFQVVFLVLFLCRIIVASFENRLFFGKMLKRPEMGRLLSVRGVRIAEIYFF